MKMATQIILLSNFSIVRVKLRSKEFRIISIINNIKRFLYNMLKVYINEIITSKFNSINKLYESSIYILWTKYIKR